MGTLSRDASTVFQRTVLVTMNTGMKNSAVFTTVQINQRHCPAEISIAVQLELESVSNSTGIRTGNDSYRYKQRKKEMEIS